MSILDSLIQIRPAWINRASYRLARGEGIRLSFQEQLEQFYDKFVQAVESGNPAWLETVVSEWVQDQTVTDLESERPSVPPILHQLFQVTFEVSRETLPGESALDLLGAVLPIYSHLLDYVSQMETEQHINHISADLERAREILVSLDKSKSDFISIAAHELKTPLTLIEGYAAMLLEQLRSNPDQAELMLNGIGNGTRRLREIIDDMIDVSLIDNNLLSLNFQPVWISRLMDVIKNEITDTVLERKLELRIHPIPGGDEMIFADGERLYQAFRNVILNAIKYTPDGGSISIYGRKLPGFLETIIADTGIGIDPEYHTSIFEKFGQLSSPALHSSGKTKFKGGGPGLGLPITRGIVEAHGGAIWVESKGYDEANCPGATFHILLPMRKESPDEKIARLFQNPLGLGADQQIKLPKVHTK